MLGLVLGFALGWFALPKVLSRGSTYDATVRMQVEQAPADAIIKIPPVVGPAPSDDSSGTSPEVLKNPVVADRVVKQLKKDKIIGAGDELTAPGLLNLLDLTPLEGSTFVDLSVSDGDPRFAAAVVSAYARDFTAVRNRAEAGRLEGVIRRLRLQADLPAPRAEGEVDQRGGGREDPHRPGVPGRRRRPDLGPGRPDRDHQRPRSAATSSWPLGCCWGWASGPGPGCWSRPPSAR